MARERYTQNFVNFMKNLSNPCCNNNTLFSIVVEDSESIDFSGEGTTDSPLTGDVIISQDVDNLLSLAPDGLLVEYTPTALNGVSVNSGNIVLGQDVSQPDNAAVLISNREIPLSSFFVRFTGADSTQGVTIGPGNIVNSGTNSHFSSSNIIGNLVISLSGPNTNINTGQSVALGGTGKSSAGYFDTRFTVQDATTFTLRAPSLIATGIDLLNATTTYNNWNAVGGFHHTFSRLSIGGPRRSASFSGTTVANFPTIVQDAMSTDRIQFSAEGSHAKTFNGFVAGLVVETRVQGTGVFNHYSDIMVGRRHGDTTMTYTTRVGHYILPIKSANVTTAYAIYQEGTVDQNYFGGVMGIGATTNNASAKLQVDSTTQGFLPPRMTTTERDAIASPAAGLVIYNTTTNKLNVRAAAAWEAVTSA
jgi:hypothetical protein